MATQIVEEYGDMRAAEAFKQGEQKKAVEDALMLIRDYNATPEIAAKKTNVPLELVLDGLKKNKVLMNAKELIELKNAGRKY